MSSRLMTIGLAICLLTIAMRPEARACGSGGSGFVTASDIALIAAVSTFGIGAGIQDIVFTAEDIRLARRGERPTRSDGIVELALNFPVSLGWTAVVATVGVIPNRGSDGGLSLQVEPYLFGPALIGALWSAALAAHGIWAIANGTPTPARPSSELANLSTEPARRRPRPLDLAITPTLVRDGNRLGGGIGVAGSF